MLSESDTEDESYGNNGRKPKGWNTDSLEITSEDSVLAEYTALRDQKDQQEYLATYHSKLWPKNMVVPKMPFVRDPNYVSPERHWGLTPKESSAVQDQSSGKTDANDGQQPGSSNISAAISGISHLNETKKAPPTPPPRNGVTFAQRLAAAQRMDKNRFLKPRCPRLDAGLTIHGVGSAFNPNECSTPHIVHRPNGTVPLPSVPSVPMLSPILAAPETPQMASVVRSIGSASKIPLWLSRKHYNSPLPRMSPRGTVPASVETIANSSARRPLQQTPIYEAVAANRLPPINPAAAATPTAPHQASAIERVSINVVINNENPTQPIARSQRSADEPLSRANSAIGPASVPLNAGTIVAAADATHSIHADAGRASQKSFAVDQQLDNASPSRRTFDIVPNGKENTINTINCQDNASKSIHESTFDVHARESNRFGQTHTIGESIDATGQSAALKLRRHGTFTFVQASPALMTDDEDSLPERDGCASEGNVQTKSDATLVPHDNKTIRLVEERSVAGGLEVAAGQLPSPRHNAQSPHSPCVPRIHEAVVVLNRMQLSPEPSQPSVNNGNSSMTSATTRESQSYDPFQSLSVLLPPEQFRNDEIINETTSDNILTNFRQIIASGKLAAAAPKTLMPMQQKKRRTRTRTSNPDLVEVEKLIQSIQKPDSDNIDTLSASQTRQLRELYRKQHSYAELEEMDDEEWRRQHRASNGQPQVLHNVSKAMAPGPLQIDRDKTLRPESPVYNTQPAVAPVVHGGSNDDDGDDDEPATIQSDIEIPSMQNAKKTSTIINTDGGTSSNLPGPPAAGNSESSVDPSKAAKEKGHQSKDNKKAKSKKANRTQSISSTEPDPESLVEPPSEPPATGNSESAVDPSKAGKEMDLQTKDNKKAKSKKANRTQSISSTEPDPEPPSEPPAARNSESSIDPSKAAKEKGHQTKDNKEAKSKKANRTQLISSTEPDPESLVEPPSEPPAAGNSESAVDPSKAGKEMGLQTKDNEKAKSKKANRTQLISSTEPDPESLVEPPSEPPAARNSESSIDPSKAAKEKGHQTKDNKKAKSKKAKRTQLISSTEPDPESLVAPTSEPPAAGNSKPSADKAVAEGKSRSKKETNKSKTNTVNINKQPKPSKSDYDIAMQQTRPTRTRQMKGAYNSIRHNIKAAAWKTPTKEPHDQRKRGASPHRNSDADQMSTSADTGDIVPSKRSRKHIKPNYLGWLNKMCDITYVTPKVDDEERVIDVRFIELDNGKKIDVCRVDKVRFREMNGVECAFYQGWSITNTGIMRFLPNTEKEMSANDSAISLQLLRGTPIVVMENGEVPFIKGTLHIEAGVPYAIRNNNDNIALIEFIVQIKH